MSASRGHRTDVAISAQARTISDETIANMKQNLAFAFVYNALGIPLAAGVLYPLTGCLLSPMIAALAMSLLGVGDHERSAPAWQHAKQRTHRRPCRNTM